MSFAEIIREPFVFFSEAFRINDLVRSACGIYSTEPVVAGRSNHLDLILAMVRAGVGITLLPDSMWRERTADGLVLLPVTDRCSPTIWHWPVCAAGIRAAAAVRGMHWRWKYSVFRM